MGVKDLREFGIGELGTGFGNEGEGEVVRLRTILFHLAKEEEGFVGVALLHSFSYAGVPNPNGLEI